MLQPWLDHPLESAKTSSSSSAAAIATNWQQSHINTVPFKCSLYWERPFFSYPESWAVDTGIGQWNLQHPSCGNQTVSHLPISSHSVENYNYSILNWQLLFSTFVSLKHLPVQFFTISLLICMSPVTIRHGHRQHF